jgi:hypothetical protein
MARPEHRFDPLWLIQDAERVGRFLTDLQYDDAALKIFVDTEREKVKEKFQHAQKCQAFVTGLSNDRSHELESAKTRRKDA